MKRTRNLLVILTAIVSLASLSFSQESMKGEKKDMMMKQDKKPMMSETYKGYIVDKLCGAGFAKRDMKTAEMKAMKHTTACALEDQCRESGYGLLLGGKFHKFDAKGDKLAFEYLSTTSKKDNLEVEVMGTKTDEGIAVTSIQDVMMKKNMKDTM